VQTPKAPSQGRFVLIRKEEEKKPSTELKVVPPEGDSISLAGPRKTRALSRRTKKKSRVGRRGVGQVPKLPPSIKTTVEHRHVWRYVCNTVQTSNNINTAELLGIGGCMTKVANTSVSSIHSSVKLHSVTIWPAPPALGATNYPAEISWGAAESDLQKDESWDSTIPNGVTSTAALRSTPPSGSLAADWLTYDGSSPIIFTLLNIAAGSVIDIEASHIMRNNVGGVDITVTTAATGTIYYLYLDSTGGKFTPVGVPTTL